MKERIIHRKRAYVALAVALGHLCLAAACAFQLDILGESRAAAVLRRYAALSGAGSSYGFFAPYVGTQLRMTCEVAKDGRNLTYLVPPPTANHEVALRLSEMVAIFWQEDLAQRRALTASVAGRMFALHPDAESVAVHLDVYELPSMRAYLEGKRPSYALHYLTRFVSEERHRASTEGEKGRAP
jgi:hypothetical protein